MDEPIYRSGYVAIVGRPNVGKSTLLNRILQFKLAITSPRPQTTRNRILGIKTLRDAQVIFVDTPGIHEPKGPLHRYMVQEALRVVSDVDLVLLLVDAARPEGKEEHSILQTLREKGASVLLGINKVDLVPKPSLLALMASFNERFPFAAIVPVSALTGDGVDTLEAEILGHLPAGPQYFPEDQLTDLPERFLAGEVVREKVFHLCGEEIPYAVAVVVEEYREQEPPRPVFIRATLYVERGSQRGILIGAGGQMLKRIGKAAREELQGLLERSVYLELWVKVEKNWSRDERAMRRLGYR